ncbi:MAG: FAD-dependent monooxygenase [Betaproteobacteria bacterium]|nr:FAD-dependent monooxygenase [Betaproteobacteria bacterium]
MSARIVIVGGGPVGLSFAIAASRLPGIEVCVIERAASGQGALPQPFDHRVYALSPASMGFLDEIGASPARARTAPVRAMQVWGDGEGSELDFKHGQPLATIVEHAAVMHALETRLTQDGNVEIRRGAAPVSMTTNDAATNVNARAISLADGSILKADLLIAADGNRSQIREWADIPVRSKDYDSDGVVANFRCERSHGDVARQWFKSDSVLAYLPLPGKHISIVWSVTRDAAKELTGLPEAELCARVAEAGNQELGGLSLVSPVARFPLARITAENWAQPGLALMGDAAHAVHPLAGQGVNLGFADARKMCEVLHDRSKFSRIGDLAVLRTYERARREAAMAVGQVTDRMRSLYLSESSSARWLRNDGMRMINRLPAAKSVLVDYATR